MKLINCIYSNIDDFKHFLEENSITNNNKILIQFFSGIIDEQLIENTITEINSILPSSTIIGATTGGEILDKIITENKLVISISIFENTKIDSIIKIEGDSYQNGIEIAKSIIHDDTKCIILFSDPFFTLSNSLFEGIKSIAPDILISGGMAGDNGMLQKALVYLNKEMTHNGVVAVTLSGEDLFVSNYYKLNWRPVGKKMKITKAEGNMVHSVDKMSVPDLYRKYLGDEIANNLPHSAATYPLVKEQDGLLVSRILFSFNEDGSANYTGSMSTGEKVRFAYANIDMILDNSYLKEFDIENFEAAYIYSCMSRKIILKDQVVLETKPIADILPMAGFFTYGEFYTYDNKPEMLNETLTLLYLTENKKVRKHIKQYYENYTESNFDSANLSSETTLRAITHLTDKVSTEIEEQNKYLIKARNNITELHKNTQDSIRYASLIQTALIPDSQIFFKYFNDHFSIWNPKDIVGGDILLCDQLRNENELLLMVIDCTGHGVPGAFVTMLVKSIETQIVSDINNSNDEISTSDILKKFSSSIKSLLKQDRNDSLSNVGFDGGILYYNKEKRIIKYSGAETPLFYIQDDELYMIKGDRESVGYIKSKNDYPFKEHLIDVKEGMQFYITTDGYLDQNGGNKGFCFGKRPFKALIQENYKEIFADQKELFLDALVEYMGDYEQNDDITVIGFRV